MIVLQVLGLILSAGFCASAALALRRRLGLEDGGTGLVCFLLFFTAVQSLLILAAGLAGALSLGPLSIASALGWGTLALLEPRPRLRLSPPPELLQRRLLALVGVAVSSFVVKAWMLGPAGGDALQYHLPKIAEWVRAGRFVWGINHDPRQWFSAGFELVETWWVVFVHHDRLIELAGVQMALLAAASVAALARAYDARPVVAGVVYLFLPAVLLHATSCGNDLAVAATILAGYALTAAGAPRAVVAFALLLGLGVKATAAFAAVGVVAFDLLLRGRPASLSRPAAAALVAGGLLLAAFWYARNWVVAGHPLYPFHGSHGEFAWMPQQAAFDAESFQHTLQALPSRMVDPHEFESPGSRITGWGWAILPLGLPALLLGLREDRRLGALGLSFVAGAAVTLSFVWFQDANFRFVLWFPALFAVALARRKAAGWIAAAVLACLVNFTATLVPYELRHSRHLYPPASVRSDAPIACVFDQAVSSYRFYNPDYSRDVSYPRSMEDLHRSGARIVFLGDTPEWAKPLQQWPRVEGRFREVR